MKHCDFAVLLLLVSGALLTGCSRKDSEPAAAVPASTHSVEQAFGIRHSTNGDVVVSVEPETQQTMGLQTASLQGLELAPEVKGFGRVLEVAPLATLVAEVMGAQAVAEASQADLRRVELLASQQNASDRVLETARAAAARDRALADSAQLRLMAGWGQTIAQRKDLAEFVRSLSCLSKVLVEVDLGAGESLAAAPVRARLVGAAMGTQPVEAEILGAAPNVDPQFQGQGYLLLVKANQGRLTPGASVTGYLSIPGAVREGVVLPCQAVVYYNGQSWVYRQTDKSAFERMAVALDTPVAGGWFVAEELPPQAQVVVTGAQQLLSEELKGDADASQ